VSANAQEKKYNYVNLSSMRFKILVEKQMGVLIDLRTPDEIKKGKIKGAIEIDFLAKNAEDKLSKLDKTKTYLLYCAGGGRSADASEFLIKQGFTNVYNLEKGFDEWTKMSYPTEAK
jgi:rhodanese-related sulfurtransferase